MRIIPNKIEDKKDIIKYMQKYYARIVYYYYSWSFL